MAPGESSDKSHYEEPYVSIRWISAARRVEVEWKAWANAAEFRAALEAALGAVREHHASKLLVDFLHAKVFAEEVQKWLAEDWIPRARAAGLSWTALVLPKSELIKFNIESALAKAQSVHDKVRFFATIEQAVSWLNEN